MHPEAGLRGVNRPSAAAMCRCSRQNNSAVAPHAAQVPSRIRRNWQCCAVHTAHSTACQLQAAGSSDFPAGGSVYGAGQTDFAPSNVQRTHTTLKASQKASLSSQAHKDCSNSNWQHESITTSLYVGIARGPGCPPFCAGCSRNLGERYPQLCAHPNMLAVFLNCCDQ